MRNENYINVLPNDTIVQSQEHSYKIVGVLGQGGFGITYKVENEHKQILALKEHFVRRQCFRGENGTDMAFFDIAADEVKGSMLEFMHEGELLVNISFQCPNIVRVYEVFEANNTVYYSMEYLAGGSLRDLVREKGPQKEDVARSLMHPIAMALTYLHGKRYLHMDIKPDNIVMRVNPDSNVQTPVLIDFGVSLHFDDKDDLTTTHHIAGVTRGFSPIEQYEPVNRFTPTVDIYALAATWFYLLAGHNPLAASDITSEWIQKELSSHVSNKTRNAIIEGMKFRAYERPQNIEAFLQLIENGSITPPSPSSDPEQPRSPLFKQIAIAVCVIAAIVGGILLGVKYCGKETTKIITDTIITSPNDTDTIAPIVTPQDTTYYKLWWKKDKTSLYITIIDEVVDGYSAYPEGNFYRYKYKLNGFKNENDSLIIKEYVSKQVGTNLQPILKGEYMGAIVERNGKNFYEGYYYPLNKDEKGFSFKYNMEQVELIDFPETNNDKPDTTIPLIEKKLPNDSTTNQVTDSIGGNGGSENIPQIENGEQQPQIESSPIEVPTTTPSSMPPENTQ